MQRQREVWSDLSVRQPQSQRLPESTAFCGRPPVTQASSGHGRLLQHTDGARVRLCPQERRAKRPGGAGLGSARLAHRPAHASQAPGIQTGASAESGPTPLASVLWSYVRRAETTQVTGCQVSSVLYYHHSLCIKIHSNDSRFLFKA